MCNKRNSAAQPGGEQPGVTALAGGLLAQRRRVFGPGTRRRRRGINIRARMTLTRRRLFANFCAGVILTCTAASITGCSGDPRSLVVTGASTVAPILGEIAKRYESLHPGVRIDVQTGGTGRGIRDARSGLAPYRHGLARTEGGGNRSDTLHHREGRVSTEGDFDRVRPARASGEGTVNIHFGQILSRSIEDLLRRAEWHMCEMPDA
jgi:hypothetical protein